jgi:hypothetical protein
MNGTAKIMANIAAIGRRYVAENLGSWDPKRLESDWWESLRFCLGVSFLRGRNDMLSNEYCSFAIRALHDYFSIPGDGANPSVESLKGRRRDFTHEWLSDFRRKNLADLRKNALAHSLFEEQVAGANPLIQALTTPSNISITWAGKTYEKCVRLGNDKDLIVLLNVLAWASELADGNAYRWIRDCIRDGKARLAYDRLTRIPYISDKIASLLIRDVALLNPGLMVSDFGWAFPIDTWVAKVAELIDQRNQGKDFPSVKADLLLKSEEYGLAPPLVAAGLWFLGYHSLEIVIECLTVAELPVAGHASTSGLLT